MDGMAEGNVTNPGAQRRLEAVTNAEASPVGVERMEESSGSSGNRVKLFGT